MLLSSDQLDSVRFTFARGWSVGTRSSRTSRQSPPSNAGAPLSLDNGLIIATLIRHKPLHVRESGGFQLAGEFLTQYASIFGSEVMRRPRPAGFRCDVKVNHVSRRIEPVPYLMNDSAFPWATKERGLLHRRSLSNQCVIVPDARYESPIRPELGAHGSHSAAHLLAG